MQAIQGPRYSSWKGPVGKRSSASFNASFILPKCDSGRDQQNPDDSCISSPTNDGIENKESDEFQPTNAHVTGKHVESQPINSPREQ